MDWHQYETSRRIYLRKNMEQTGQKVDKKWRTCNPLERGRVPLNSLSLKFAESSKQEKKGWNIRSSVAKINL